MLYMPFTARCEERWKLTALGCQLFLFTDQEWLSFFPWPHSEWLSFFRFPLSGFQFSSFATLVSMVLLSGPFHLSDFSSVVSVPSGLTRPYFPFFFCTSPVPTLALCFSYILLVEVFLCRLPKPAFLDHRGQPLPPISSAGFKDCRLVCSFPFLIGSYQQSLDVHIYLWWSPIQLLLPQRK